MTYRITVFDIDGNIKTVRKFTDEKEWSIAFSEYGQCGKYRRSWFKTSLILSFQFHHTQMDGAHAAHFLDLLQREIDTLKI